MNFVKRKALKISLFFVISTFAFQMSCGKSGGQDMTSDFKDFVSNYEKKVVPLSKELNLAYFEATTSGKEELYQKYADLQVELSKINSNREDFAKLKKFKASNSIIDLQLKRELEVLYNAYLDNQIDPAQLEKMINKQAEIEKKFSTFRAELNGKKVTDNEIEEILKNETDSQKLENTWVASKQVGQEVADDIKELVEMRNAAARELGFSNFHAMKLKLNEQDPDTIEALFNELDDLTRDAFAKLKDEMDVILAKRYHIKKEQLMPWHYQNRFFQEAPKIYNVDLDKYYQDKDIISLVKQFYAGIRLPIDDLVKASDLYEREGKYQHAYCTDIDKEGDVRVVGNVKPNAGWMNTMLHEYGHAVYDKFSDKNLPWLLREPAHTFTTEAVAMLFGRFASNPAWLHDMVGVPEQETQKIAGECEKSLRLEQLVFSRWAQVMYRFEKNMYENPDQDLNKLWWDLVEKYQMIKRPENRDFPDWAAKIHVALYPAYYHNYLMGELLASQLYYYISENVLHSADIRQESFANQKAVGQYLINNVFKPGKIYYWNDMIEKATGEKLTAKYFAKQFVM
ncbi:MAG: M2 family metallopeptidase [Calditrichia bacterium]